MKVLIQKWKRDQNGDLNEPEIEIVQPVENIDREDDQITIFGTEKDGVLICVVLTELDKDPKNVLVKK